MQEPHKSSIIKATTWRMTGTFGTFVISFLVNGEVTFAITISLSEIVTKICLYYFHEHVWNKISWKQNILLAHTSTNLLNKKYYPLFNHKE
ncbi:DUF2061 domain-containing protein [Candidatus Tisiphia endosymbiont of Nemotelus uliginosus]|uniref:DUF2061 domain-containing protein n=1 Tax=Candidatus Tisiphia endosymbiont of Nemotelus uliginosus TaxID=3077926 RepID=UPI0035C92A69